MELSDMVSSAFDAYCRIQRDAPILGSMTTSSFIYPVADIVSQKITTKKVNWRKVAYTLCLAPLYGVLVHYTVRSADLVEACGMHDPLAKAALGPNLWGNLFNVGFFMNNTVGKESNYRIRDLTDHYAKLAGGMYTKSGIREKIAHMREYIIDKVPRKQYMHALLATLTGWNAFQYLNYTKVPEHLQTATTLGVAMMWTILLSAWSLHGKSASSVGSPISDKYRA